MDMAAESAGSLVDEEEASVDGEAKLIKADCCQICGEKFAMMQKLSVVSIPQQSKHTSLLCRGNFEVQQI